MDAATRRTSQNPCVEVLAFALFALLLSACASPARYQQQATDQRPIVVTADSDAPPGAPPLLWKLTRPNHGTLFMFGTMHFGVSHTQLPPVVIETLESSDIFVLESDPTSADPQRLADLMMLPQGSDGVDERLGPERWEKLLVVLDGAFEPRVAARVQPWVLEAAATQEIMPAAESMELGLVEMAQAKQLPVAYLEDWETQIRMLNKVSSVEALAEIVDDPELFHQRTRAMSADYIRGDVAALEGHIFGADYEAQDEVFEARNRAWLQRLEELSVSGRAFIAVGAGHLVGPNNVLDLLAERGFTVERMK